MTSIIATPVSIPKFCDRTTDRPPPSSKNLLSSGSCVKDEKKIKGGKKFENKKDTLNESFPFSALGHFQV